MRGMLRRRAAGVYEQYVEKTCIDNLHHVDFASMELTTYIETIGRREAARRFGVTTGAVSHWMTGKRLPSTEIARVIVAVSPVTWEGIYSTKRKASEEHTA